MQLTTEKALQIYEFKLSCRLHPLSDSRIQSLRGQSGPVAKLFGVTSRTIRDIWNRQSWSFATRPLWNREPDFIATMAGRRAGITTMEVWHFLELFHSWPRLDHYIQQDVRDKQLKAGRTKVSRGNSQRIRRLKTLRAAAAGPQCDYSEESSSAVPELLTTSDGEPTASATENQSVGKQLGAEILDILDSWTREPHISAESDPFRSDWPYW
jgi:hypothetical protein